MPFGVYVHIPYCLQRCLYCDFATYEQSKIMPPEKYVEIIKREIDLKMSIFQPRPLDTLYFGGGTPSLLPAHLIIEIIHHLEKQGFVRKENCETTIEINPATVDPKKLDQYLENKINRFSVGAQTFDDSLLKMVHREHSAKQTLETLDLLNSYHLNYNFDLLFALPRQTLDGLKKDLDVVAKYSPPHLSPYCLTVPSGHILTKGRPLEGDQVKMFEFVHEALTSLGHEPYEISNYSKVGFESRHNLLYWTDAPYWGIGLSAHSYLSKKENDVWGYRFWNHKNIDDYEKSVLSAQGKSYRSPDEMEASCYERLCLADSLTDYSHTSLRLQKGLSKMGLLEKFGAWSVDLVSKRLEPEILRGRVVETSTGWTLTRDGIPTSNLVIEQVYFEGADLKGLQA